MNSKDKRIAASQKCIDLFVCSLWFSLQQIEPRALYLLDKGATTEPNIGLLTLCEFTGLKSEFPPTTVSIASGPLINWVIITNGASLLKTMKPPLPESCNLVTVLYL